MYKKNIVPPPRSRRATNPTPDRPRGGTIFFFVHICIFLTFLYILQYLLYVLQYFLCIFIDIYSILCRICLKYKEKYEIQVHARIPGSQNQQWPKIKAKVVEARAKNSNGRPMPKIVLENHSFAYLSKNLKCKQKGTVNMGARARCAPMLPGTFLITFSIFL